MNNTIKLIATLIVGSVNLVHAQSLPDVTVYGGTGTNRESAFTPWTVGTLFTATRGNINGNVTGGFDVSGEGVSVDNTGGTFNGVKQGIAVNGLLGTRQNIGRGVRYAVVGLIGIRRTGERCDRSYLGFRCYADDQPEVSYAVNYGMLGYVSYKKTMVGVRVTGQSTQFIVGATF